MMTPKEKAKELYHRFQVYEVNGLKIMKYGPEVKVFTLIAIDFAKEFITGDLNESFDKALYLFEVKEEIEKL